MFKFLSVFFLIFAWVFSGWSPTMSAAGDTNKISKKEVKIKFDNSQLVGKYEMRGASFHKTIKSDKAEKTEVRIGNENAASFEPSFEFKKWDEVRFKITPKMGAVAETDKDFDVVGDKIKYKTPKEEVDFYELMDSPALHGGGYEIERILNEKPATNVLDFDMETENLEFFYQPIYTDAEIEEKASNEDFVNRDAMGSYVVYYKNVPLNYIGSKNYGTGKVGQIYRPRIDDSAGNSAYGELNIDVTAKKLTVTIPQDFLDTAIYPIYHASGLVFGYQTIGTAGNITIENSIKGSVFTMGTNAGAVDSITVYSNPSATTRTFGTAIYVSSSNALVANSGSTAQTPAATGAAWRTVTYGTRPSLTGGTNYILAEWGSSGTGTHVIYYDTGTTNQGQTDANTGPFTWPNPLVPSGTTNKYSIYATYSPVPDAPTSVAATDGSATDKVTITWTKSTGATDYHVWRDSTDLGAAGDVATFDDTGAAAPTVTAGTASATDGSATDKVTLSISGASANNGTTYTYKVVASNAAGNSADSATNTGYRGVGSLTYQWNRSSGDADSGYSTLSGATTAPYDDTTAPAPTITAGTASASDGTSADYVSLSVSGQSANVGASRYFYATVSATGASSADTTHDRGYIGVGSLTYQWQRSTADSDASYANIDGATTASYNDTGAPSDGSGRYYKVVEDATGATQQTSTSDRGYRSGAVSSVSITPAGDIEYGFVSLSNSTTTIGSTYTKTAANDGTVVEKLNVKSSDATTGTTWTLASTIGSNQFKHEFSTTTGATWTVMPDSATYVTAKPSVAVSGTVDFDFRLTAPSSSDYQQKSITITVQAVAP